MATYYAYEVTAEDVDVMYALPVSTPAVDFFDAQTVYRPAYEVDPYAPPVTSDGVPAIGNARIQVLR
jgi:hypothetical protein